ncbi:MAG: hypothetical protein K2I00_10490 [Ruminococcus sp.]|nr:hypothetical protein [Ruminococcus sp.]
MRKHLTRNTVHNRSNLLADSILISGGCYPLKERIIGSLNNQDSRTVVINLDETSEYMTKFTPDYDYHISDTFSYANIFSDLTLRDARRLVRDRASDFNYSHSDVGQLLKYFDLIDRINAKLNLSFESLTDINKYYYNPDIVQDCIEEMYDTSNMSRTERDILQNSLYRSIGGQLFLENLMAEINFDINFDEDGFSLRKLKAKETALLELSGMHSNSISDSTAVKALLYDIECYRNPLLVIINVGNSDLNYIETSLKVLLKRSDIKLITIADDIFAQADNVHRFIKLFDFNAFGSHTGNSATEMEKIFPVITKTDYHVTSTYNRRLLSEKLIDKIFGKDYTEAIAKVPVQRHELESKDISTITPDSFILIDNTQKHNMHYSIQTIQGG